eukprot:scaffold42280_cov57-Phaeocystis_antarctica.AAC.1
MASPRLPHRVEQARPLAVHAEDDRAHLGSSVAVVRGEGERRGGGGKGGVLYRAWGLTLLMWKMRTPSAAVLALSAASCRLRTSVFLAPASAAAREGRSRSSVVLLGGVV